MRNVIIGLGIAAAALTVGTQASEAQTQYPFGSRPYCWSGNKANGGMPECSFYTWDQCRATLHGGADHCFENPTLAWNRLHGAPQGKQKRRTGKRSY